MLWSSEWISVTVPRPSAHEIPENWRPKSNQYIGAHLGRPKIKCSKSSTSSVGTRSSQGCDWLLPRSLGLKWRPRREPYSPIPWRPSRPIESCRTRNPQDTAWRRFLCKLGLCIMQLTKTLRKWSPSRWKIGGQASPINLELRLVFSVAWARNCPKCFL
jgi:hypothetical protein